MPSFHRPSDINLLLNSTTGRISLLLPKAEAEPTSVIGDTL